MVNNFKKIKNEAQKNYAANDSGNGSFIFSGKSTRQ